MWVLKPEWAGFIGPGPFTDDEFMAECKAYAEANGWTLEDVLRDQHQYVNEDAAVPEVEE